MRCEAATYAWISQECSSTGLLVRTFVYFSLFINLLLINFQFTSREHLPFFAQPWHSLKCMFRTLLRLPLPSRLVQQATTISNKLGLCLLIDFIEESDARMLSDAGERPTPASTNRHRWLLTASKPSLLRQLIYVFIPRHPNMCWNPTEPHFPPKIAEFVEQSYGFNEDILT